MNMAKKQKSILTQIKEAKKTGKKVLRLYSSNESFSNWPDELFELTNLEELYIGGSILEVDEISRNILRLTKLKKLELRIKLNSFPNHLYELKKLREISLSKCSFEELPEDLNAWNALEYLNLGQTKIGRINGLPPNLTYLYLNGFGASEFPSEVFKLGKLRKLVANGYRTETVPAELSKLASLQVLFLSDWFNPIFPSELNKLQKLEWVWLKNCGLLKIPEFVFNQRNLIRLELDDNSISKIPDKIKLLTKLQALMLPNNSLKKFPLTILELKHLREIDISNVAYKTTAERNSIDEIPSGILDLVELTKLRVSGLDILNIPDSIVEDGLDSIRNYLQSKIEADSEEYLYEAKMVVVGRGDVGKTVLTKKLINPKYSLDESDTTVGIDVLKNPFSLKMKGLKRSDSFKFNIWDFGGQEKYDATHQVFLTNRSLYLFLTEARDESNYQDVFHWLSTISLFSNNSPVIVVLSKFDERKKLLPETLYQSQFPNIIGFVDVSCADGFEGTINTLKKVIEKGVNYLPQTKQTLSNHWVDVRNELERLSEEKDYIPYNDYLEICAANHLDQIRADFLSAYLNDLGVIVHHSDNLLLKKTVFVNTDWCVDGMYKVLDSDIVFDQNGKFSDANLSAIWHESRFETKQAELLGLMLDYGLCFELADGTGYIAPDMLPPDQPKSLIWKMEQTLQFEYRYEFMPAGIVSRFIVKSHGFIKDDLFWKYGVVLSHENTQALVTEDYINGKVKISIAGDNKKGLLAAVRMLIAEVHREFNKTNKLGFEELVPCNCKECGESKTPHFFKYHVLEKHEKAGLNSTLCDISSEFVEIKSLINDVILGNPTDYFETDEELKDFVTELIDTVLEREVALKGGYNNFWRDQTCKIPKNEVEVHPYICNVLDNYCKVKGIKLAREVQEANGNVDILFSCTNKQEQVLQVAVEVKKAHHQDVESAINSQLPKYMESMGTESGIYLVLWCKSNSFDEPKKFSSKKGLLDSIQKNNPDTSNITVRLIDCCKPLPPSKRKVLK